MNKLTSFLFVLLIAAGLSTTQVVYSQTHFNASQSSTSFKVTTLNAEWLTCTGFGPTDEALQLNNIAAVIKALNSDIVALQEVGTSSTYATIDTIVSRLGLEWAGSIVPSTNTNCGQNEGIVYKKAKVQLVSASLMEAAGTLYNWSSGRYPVLYEVNLLADGSEVPVSLINIHAKAMNDETSYSRRKGASETFKALLDGSSYNSKKVIILGDFNDYLIGTQCSTCSPSDSPYKNFMDDTANYKGLTSSLYDTSYNSPVIDNIIISNELVGSYSSNSAVREVSATETIDKYSTTTTDHVPVSATFIIGGDAVTTPDCDNISFSETFSSSLGDFTPYSVAGDQTWLWRSSYGATATGYVAPTNNVNEDWLISPAFDLSTQRSATLAFYHAINFCPSATDIVTNQTLWVSSNYTSGAPASATWTQLTIPTMPSGSAWTFVNSGNVAFPDEMMQSNIHFAFKYLSSVTVAGTWEVEALTLNSECKSTSLSTELAAKNLVYVVDGKIKIKNEQPENVTVYSIAGIKLFSTTSVMNAEYAVSQKGVYLVRVGNDVNKIMLK